MRKWRTRRCWHPSLVVGLAAGLFLTACQSWTTQPEDAAAPWPALAADYLARPATVYALQPQDSTLHLYVYRAGAASRLGHNHVLSVQQFEGYVQISSAQPQAAACELRVPLDALVVDDPRLRAETGGAFANERSAADIAGTRHNMLGEKGLDAARYPLLRLRCAAVRGDWPQLIADVDITLHGVTRRETVALMVTHDAAMLRVRGTLILRQSDYGITPFSVLGGLMAVQDEVVLHFDLHGQAISSPAPADGAS